MPEANHYSYASDEAEYGVDLVVHIRNYGHEVHQRQSIIDRVAREMYLMFGDRAEVEELDGSSTVQLQQNEVEPEEVPKVGYFEALSGVQRETSTGWL